MIVDLALAFLAGLLSFASTCVLPLVPAYVAYMGAASSGTTITPRQQLKVLGNAALFVGGFATAFVALGASFGLIGADLKAYRPLLLQIAGAALVLIGIALLTLGRIPGLMGEKRFDIVVVITAPPEVRAQRRPIADERERRLLAEDEKIRLADYTYVNDGTLEELDAFVARVMADLAT